MACLHSFKIFIFTDSVQILLVLFIFKKFFYFKNWVPFCSFFPISPLTRRNSPFTIFPQYMDPIPFAARPAPLNYCRANVTFLPLSAKVLIHRLFPNTNPISTDLEPLLELGQLSFIALGRRFVDENIFHALFPLWFMDGLRLIFSVGSLIVK